MKGFEIIEADAVVAALQRQNAGKGDWLLVGRTGRQIEFMAPSLGLKEEFSSGKALLHKSLYFRTSPYPGQTYPAVFVMGMQSAVKPFETATWTCNSIS